MSRAERSWKYLYRAVDYAGATVDCLLTAKRDINNWTNAPTASQFLSNPMSHYAHLCHGTPGCSSPVRD